MESVLFLKFTSIRICKVLYPKSNEDHVRGKFAIQGPTVSCKYSLN